jgi:hypothetical protein
MLLVEAWPSLMFTGVQLYLEQRRTRISFRGQVPVMIIATRLAVCARWSVGGWRGLNMLALPECLLAGTSPSQAATMLWCAMATWTGCSMQRHSWRLLCNACCSKCWNARVLAAQALRSACLQH